LDTRSCALEPSWLTGLARIPIDSTTATRRFDAVSFGVRYFVSSFPCSADLLGIQANLKKHVWMIPSVCATVEGVLSRLTVGT